MVTAKLKKSTAKPKARRAAPPKPRPKSKGKAKAQPKHSAAKRPAPSSKLVPKKTAPTPASTAKPTKGSAVVPAGPPVAPRMVDGRRHVLSLSFLRDGDEFFARIESNGGQITEFKNRALDQLLTLVASELEDLVE